MIHLFYLFSCLTKASVGMNKNERKVFAPEKKKLRKNFICKAGKAFVPFQENLTVQRDEQTRCSSIKNIFRLQFPSRMWKNKSEIRRMKEKKYVAKAIKMFHHCLIMRVKIFFISFIVFYLCTFSYTFQLNLDLFHSIFSISCFFDTRRQSWRKRWP